MDPTRTRRAEERATLVDVAGAAALRRERVPQQRGCVSKSRAVWGQSSAAQRRGRGCRTPVFREVPSCTTPTVRTHMLLARVRQSVLRTPSGVRRMGGGHPGGYWSEGTQTGRNGYLFGESPPPPGQSRKWESWEAIWCVPARGFRSVDSAGRACVAFVFGAGSPRSGGADSCRLRPSRSAQCVAGLTLRNCVCAAGTQPWA